MPKVALFIKTRSKAGKRGEIKALWEKHLKPGAEANPEQETHVFCFDAQDQNTLYVFEMYSSFEALERAGQGPAFGRYMQDLMPLLDGMPEVHTSLALWGKGVEV